jgi:hypothetical protein
VADCFHAAKHYHHAADEVRKQELQRLKKELPKEEYKQLNGSFRAFRKNAKDLNQEEQKALKRFFGLSVLSKQTYILRDQLPPSSICTYPKNKPNPKFEVGSAKFKKAD